MLKVLQKASFLYSGAFLWEGSTKVRRKKKAKQAKREKEKPTPKQLRPLLEVVHVAQWKKHVLALSVPQHAVMQWTWRHGSCWLLCVSSTACSLGLTARQSAAALWSSRSEVRGREASRSEVLDLLVTECMTAGWWKMHPNLKELCLQLNARHRVPSTTLEISVSDLECPIKGWLFPFQHSLDMGRGITLTCPQERWRNALCCRKQCSQHLYKAFCLNKGLFHTFLVFLCKQTKCSAWNVKHY